MTLSLLKKIRDVLYENVCMDIKLREAADDDVYEYELVNPSAFVGWIPPTTEDIWNVAEGLMKQKSVPCLLVSYDEDDDDGQESAIHIRLTFVVYGPGLQTSEKKIESDFTGYENLINFMDRTKAFLLRSKLSLKAAVIASSVKSTMYKEQPFPMWLGSITFTCTYEPYVNLDVTNIDNSFLL